MATRETQYDNWIVHALDSMGTLELWDRPTARDLMQLRMEVTKPLSYEQCREYLKQMTFGHRYSITPRGLSGNIIVDKREGGS